VKSITRGVVASFVGGCLIAAIQLPASAGTRPTAKVSGVAIHGAVTVSARSRLPVWVIYHSKRYSSVRISGHVTNASAGMVLKLYARRFPFSGRWRAIRRARFTHAGTNYFRFVATPTLATRYREALFRSSRSRYPLAVSHATTVYVVADYKFRYRKLCRTRPICHLAIHVRVVTPPSALATEIAKPIFTYFGHQLSRTGIPPRPKWLNLGAGNPAVSGPRKVAADQYDLILRFSFRIGRGNYSWLSDFCTKNTEAADGLYLPGHHHCGNQRISSTIRYLG
jgi:hypothetical protein